ncbi:MAG: hypothetical protein NBV67_07775 [Tagaea sp.]|nr:hypothetical protein [Tagaea sp.]
MSTAFHTAADLGADLGERRYLVATLLIDAWLPRAMERELEAAERKAMYWSAIYGPQRTRISEVFVPGLRRPPPRMGPAPPPLAPPEPAAPAPRKSWLARFDRPVDPAYAKAMCDMFLIYVAMRLTESIGFLR